MISNDVCSLFLDYSCLCYLYLQRRLLRAKERHRPKLANWEKDKFATCRENDFLALGDLPNGFTDMTASELEIQRVEDNSCASCITSINRTNCTDLSCLQFARYFEQPAIPCIISGIPVEER